MDAKFAKLSKLVDGRGEKQAHVVVTSERHLHKAEITLHSHNHQLVGIGSDSDVFTAMCAALDRIEKQAAKQSAQVARDHAPVRTDQGRCREGRGARLRRHKKRRVKPLQAGSDATRVFRPDHHERRKPITLEEALLEMEDGRDYVAYRDADKQVVSMLIRRRDGHYDLIET